MSGFVEILRKGSGFELCGRMLRSGEELVFFIDDVGRFTIPVRVVLVTILGLGDGEVTGPISGVYRLSHSGRGLYLDIGDLSYVTPVARVRAVIDGKNRKGPVSKIR